jgi:hypothetical protein
VKEIDSLAAQSTTPADLIILSNWMLKRPYTLWVHDLVFKQNGRISLGENGLNLYVTGQIRVDGPSTAYQVMGFEPGAKANNGSNGASGGNAGQTGMNGSPGGQGGASSAGLSGRSGGSLLIQFVNRECSGVPIVNIRIRIDGESGGDGENGGPGGSGGTGACGGNGGDGGIVTVLCSGRKPSDGAQWMKRVSDGFRDTFDVRSHLITPLLTDATEDGGLFGIRF